MLRPCFLAVGRTRDPAMRQKSRATWAPARPSMTLCARVAQCRAQQKAGGATAAPTVAPAPAAPAPTIGQAPAVGGKTTSQCDAEYAANKAAIKSSGQTKRAFVAACRAGNETIPLGAAAAPAPAPAPVPPTGSLAPAPAPAPASTTYSTAPAATGAGEFASDQQARAHCPSDTVVWVNTRSGVYHFAERTITGIRRKARICARPTPRPPATGRR